MLKSNLIIIKPFSSGIVFSLLLIIMFGLVRSQRAEAATCLDGVTPLPASALTGGHEYDFCKSYGGYSGGDPSVCNDGTVIADNARTGGHEVDFCSTHLGYLGSASGVTPKPTVDTITPATDPAASCDTSTAGDSTCGFVHNYIDPAIKFLAVGFGIIITIMIIVGGIQYSSSKGDPQAVAAAKKRLTNAVLALIAFGFLYAFLNFIIPGGLL